MPPDPPHSITIPLSLALLQAIFIPLNAHLRTENPLLIPSGSQPQPDILVVNGAPRDYLAQHPQPADVLLLIEVSDSTLQTDRSVKSPLYAEAGISEYWILNLQDRQLEVHRTPLNGIWTSTFVVPSSGTVTPLAAPNATIAIVDLLP
ncbi:MAG: Uma2 family endonuclease [Armatimonas sp.]